MSIEIAVVGALSCPIASCDLCGRRVTNADGHIRWISGDDRGSSAIEVVHRECDRATKRPGSSWMALDVFFARLAHNAGAPAKKTESRAAVSRRPKAARATGRPGVAS